jgi:copper chaperone CopZ
MTDSPAERFSVKGMTCDHCVRSVSEGIAEVPGVEGVDVDLQSGLVAVSGEFSNEAVVAAVEEAGYEAAK